MAETAPGPSKGYQKKIKKDESNVPPKPKRDPADYASPMAKKWPLMHEALESGNVEAVKKLIEEGMNVNVLRAGVTPLMIAASKGYREVAEVIMQAGVNVNEKGDDGGTALHMAASEQAGAEIIDLLMESGVDVEAKNKAGKTALQLAEEKGHRDIVRVIRKHQQQLKIDAQEWEAFLNTPEGRPYKQSGRLESLSTVFKLWWAPIPAFAVLGALLGLLFKAALLTGIISAVCGLLAGGALFFWEKKLRSYLDAIGPLPFLDIHIVREKRRAGEPIFVVKKKQPVPAEEASEDLSGEHVADDGASTVLVDPETEAGSGPEANIDRVPSKLTQFLSPRMALYGSLAIVLAALAGALVLYRGPLLKLYYAKKLAYRGIEFSAQSFLNEAAKNNEGAVELFLRAGMTGDAKNEKGQTALMIASAQGHAPVLRRLIKLNPGSLNQYDTSGNTALMTASRQGREDIVRLLVEGGADVNYVVPVPEGAATALQAAADVSGTSDKQVNVVTYLLEKGADAKGRNKAGRFPLLFAADQGRTDIAGVLIERGAAVNETDSRGDFALLAAACKGETAFVALLLEKGADLKRASSDGQTPLMCAVQNDRKDMVKVLLAKGAAVNEKKKSGETAITEATRTGNVDIVKMLLAQGADPARGYLPESFSGLEGRPVTVKAKKSRLRDLLRWIAGAAAQDGYTISLDSSGERKITMKAKLPWNKALVDMARKNRLLLVVKDKSIVVLSSEQTAARQKAR